MCIGREEEHNNQFPSDRQVVEAHICVVLLLLRPYRIVKIAPLVLVVVVVEVVVHRQSS